MVDIITTDTDLARMNRNNYDRGTIAIFDAIGTHFVDMIYNNHYLVAGDHHREGRSETFTGAYVTLLRHYSNGVRQGDCYRQVVKNLHMYCQKSMVGTAMVFLDFEDRVLSQIIPSDYFNDLTSDEKDDTLHNVIITCVSELCVIATTMPMLGRIVDDHRNLDNVKILQENAIDILLTIREEYYGKFARKLSRKGLDNMIDRDLFEKLKMEYVKEKKLKIQANQDLERSRSIIRQLVGKCKELLAENSGLKNGGAAPPIAYRSQPAPAIVAPSPPPALATDVATEWLQSSVNGGSRAATLSDPRSISGVQPPIPAQYPFSATSLLGSSSSSETEVLGVPTMEDLLNEDMGFG